MTYLTKLVLGTTVLFATLCSSAWSQTINVLIAGDTNDRRIGESVTADIGNLLFTFYSLVPERQLRIEILEGQDVTKTRILTAIKRYRAGPADAMVFLWSGHGGYDGDGHYFVLPGGARLYRSVVVSAVRDRGAGTDVVLSDSCNVFVPMRRPPVAPEPKKPTRIAPLLDSLLLKAHGLVDINGASKGEVGLGDPVHGGTFFWPLCEYLQQNANRKASWKTVIRELQPKVHDAFRQTLRDGKRGVSVEPAIARLAQTTQTIHAWHLPPGWPSSTGSDGRSGGGRGYRFGVDVRDNGGYGAYVHRVFRGSPAEKAEVERGDIVLSVNGEKITSEDEMVDAVYRSPRRMKFTIRGARTGKIWHLEATLRH